MSFFQDTFSVFKKRELSFLERCKETDDVYTFLFEKGKDITWKAGQHGLFDIVHRKIKNRTRPFSVATAPAENVVKITTRISDDPSEFKQAMLELEKGMMIKMSGPVGRFYLKDDGPVLLIAGGIGITPFRAILKQRESEGNIEKEQMRLLYLDGEQTYIFKDELDDIADKTSISINYLDLREKLYQEIDTFAALHHNEANYFVAGPKPMADSISAYLQNKNVPKKNIKKDAFFGY